VVDPYATDNSFCWMTMAEFKKLRSKDDWRRRFAVWEHWNSDGEYVVYTVPPGAGLPVWRGTTASQQLKYSEVPGHVDDEVVLAGNANERRQAQRVKEGKVKTDDPPEEKYFWTEGGAEQLGIDPKHLQLENISLRQPTGWGYDTSGKVIDLVGVPLLSTNWNNWK
jgi:hypothetical protein